MRETLTDRNGRYDEVIVDVAGHDSRELRTTMLAAHQIIVVSRPSQLDLDTLEHMSEVVDQARDLNPDLEALGLLTQVPTNPSVTERVDGGAYLADFPTLKPLSSVIFERKAYRDVICEGLGVVEWSNPKAKAEIETLVAEVEK
ncbi:ParA family protein [Ornithinimicrobium sp. INDO-MA30-4]|uniref:ParA family protein n=1 Tax=Ornithinimicrobium sp. INDO-MA30-4 TaxID=2908651 RepID=UPI001F34D359|nr:ParA family protein [Ornithinimicrobium sp. INDO-MA30-4]UJH70173.1 ParA family protein [Ornithinimicrobium sp. INDO-MA30-4]